MFSTQIKQTLSFAGIASSSAPLSVLCRPTSGGQDAAQWTATDSSKGPILRSLFRLPMYHQPVVTAPVDSMITGTAPFNVPAAAFPCHTFYKIFGDLRSAAAPPLFVLHGGAGSGHEYCLPFGRLWSLYKIPVIVYDQIGCAASTHLREKAGDRSFWNYDLFADELANLIKYIGITGSYDVLGHSFGGVLATVFAARKPPGLRRLILIGTPATGPLFLEGLWELTKQLSVKSQDAIHEMVRKSKISHESYVEAVQDQAYLDASEELGRTFLCRADPWPPAELALDFKNHADDTTVRYTFVGMSPWVYEGLLGEWDGLPYLPLIDVPTFVINGEHDTTQYLPTAPLFENIPRVRWMTVANASHMGHLDSPELQQQFLKLVAEFLGVKTE